MDETLSNKERTINPQEFSYEDKNYSVPEFFAYDHKSTKWIITLLSTPDGLKRLSLMGKENGRLFETYFQIPDEPKIFTKNMHYTEQPAYHPNGVLYLNPLGLAIYMKQSEAVRVLLKLKNKQGTRIIHPNEICFVQQRSTQQSPEKPCNDLQSTYPALVAVRRGFAEGLGLLMNAGYNPQKEFGIICRKGDGETLSIYRDLVDYALDLLRTKPGINITNIIKTITNPTIRNSYDIYTYDVEVNPETEQEEWISVFRRVAQMGARNNYASHRNGVAIISVLETLQRLGFLKGLIYENKDVSNTPLPHRSIGSAMSIMVDKNIKSQKPVEKVNRNNMIDDPNAYSRVTYDRDASIGAILVWYQLILQNGRGIQKEKIELLIAKCLWDTESIKLFFGLENEQIALVFNNWIDTSTQEIRPETLRHLRNAMLHQYTYVQKLYLPFIKKYHFEPKDLIRRGPVPFNTNQIINPEWIKRPLYFPENADTHVSRGSEILNENSQETKTGDGYTKELMPTVIPSSKPVYPKSPDNWNQINVKQEISPEPSNIVSINNKKNLSVSYGTEALSTKHTSKYAKQVNFDSSLTEFSNFGLETKVIGNIKDFHRDMRPNDGDNITIDTNIEAYHHSTMLSPKANNQVKTPKTKSKKKSKEKSKRREVQIEEDATESDSPDSCGSGSTIEIIKTKINRKTKQKHQTVYKVKDGKKVKKYELDYVRDANVNNHRDICQSMNKPLPHLQANYSNEGISKRSNQLTVIEVDDCPSRTNKRSNSSISDSSQDIPCHNIVMKQNNQQNRHTNIKTEVLDRCKRLQQSTSSTPFDQDDINNSSEESSTKTSDTKTSSTETLCKSTPAKSNASNNTPPRFERTRVINRPNIEFEFPQLALKEAPENPRPSSQSSADTTTGGTANIQNTMSAIMRQFVMNMNTNGALKLMR